MIKRPTSGDPSFERSRISVVIPCYNYEAYLRDCVESVLSQVGVDVDVTIVDDASTDDSARVGAELVAQDPRVKLIRHETNRGHIHTFNDALDAATAEFVVKMDADDLAPPGAFERAIRLLRSYPRMAFSYGYPQTFSQEPPVATEARVRSWSVWEGEEWIARVVERAHNVIMQPEVVMRRTAIDKVGGHRAEIPEASDLNLWLRLASVGQVGRVNGPVQGMYRVHEKSMQRTIHAGYLSDLRGRLAAFDLFFDEHGARLRSGESLERKGHRALARDAVRIARRAQDNRKESTEPIAEYLAIATELDSTVRSTRLWRQVQRAMRSTTTRRGLGSFLRDLEDKLRWRMWRRYGL